MWSQFRVHHSGCESREETIWSERKDEVADDNFGHARNRSRWGGTEVGQPKAGSVRGTLRHNDVRRSLREWEKRWNEIAVLVEFEHNLKLPHDQNDLLHT